MKTDGVEWTMMFKARRAPFFTALHPLGCDGERIAHRHLHGEAADDFAKRNNLRKLGSSKEAAAKWVAAPDEMGLWTSQMSGITLL